MKLCRLNICSLLYVNFVSIKLLPKNYTEKLNDKWHVCKVILHKVQKQELLCKLNVQKHGLIKLFSSISVAKKQNTFMAGYETISMSYYNNTPPPKYKTQSSIYFRFLFWGLKKRQETFVISEKCTWERYWCQQDDTGGQSAREWGRIFYIWAYL